MKKGIVGILSLLSGVIAGAIGTREFMSKKVKVERQYAEKHLTLYRMMNEWVRIKQEGKNLALFFEENNYKKIAVYGMSYAGETLLKELKGTGIQVSYGIDRNADVIYEDSEVDIITMEDPLRKVDAIVVTAVTFFDEIEEELRKKIACPILSLEDVLYEVC